MEDVEIIDLLSDSSSSSLDDSSDVETIHPRNQNNELPTNEVENNTKCLTRPGDRIQEAWSDWRNSIHMDPNGSKVLEMEYLPSWKSLDEYDGLYCQRVSNSIVTKQQQQQQQQQVLDLSTSCFVEELVLNPLDEHPEWASQFRIECVDIPDDDSNCLNLQHSPSATQQSSFQHEPENHENNSDIMELADILSDDDLFRDGPICPPPDIANGTNGGFFFGVGNKMSRSPDTDVIEATRNLSESMHRSQDSRIAVAMNTSKKMGEYSRQQNISEALSYIEKSGTKIQNPFQSVPLLPNSSSRSTHNLAEADATSPTKNPVTIPQNQESNMDNRHKLMDALMEKNDVLATNQWNNRSPTKQSTTTQPPIVHAAKKKQQPNNNFNIKIRHVLLGNQEESEVNHHKKDDEEEERYLYFVPDFITELHTKLTKLQLEYAWLLEESQYVYQEHDPTFCYKYASPYLKIVLRSHQHNRIVPGSHQGAFDIKRKDIRRQLQNGHRRGPIMSRILAQLRFARRKQQQQQQSKTTMAAHAKS